MPLHPSSSHPKIKEWPIQTLPTVQKLERSRSALRSTTRRIKLSMKKMSMNTMRRVVRRRLKKEIWRRREMMQ